MAALLPHLHESLDLDRPFTWAQGLAAGLRPAEMRTKDFRQVTRGVYMRARAPERPFERVEAALLVHAHAAGAYASHTSAARVYRLPVPERLTDEHVSVFRREDRRRPRGVCPHLAPESAQVIVIAGIAVSAPAQLFLELAGLLNLVELVVVGDALVKQRRILPEGLVAAAAAYSGRGAALARRAASFVRQGVDSPMETRLRMLIVLAGLPEPTVDFRIYDDRGRLRYRLDLSYPDLKLAVEYDGRQHAHDPVQWTGDVARDSWFDRERWYKIRVLSGGVYRTPEQTLCEVRDALKERGARVPRRFRSEWRSYFPAGA